MMRWIVESSLKARLPVVAIAVGVMVLGVVQLSKAPVDALPEFEGPRVEVQTEALGLSAAEVESLVTLGLEETLSSTAELETIRSESVAGLSSIELIFEPGTDPTLARQLVQERLSSAFTLPKVSKPPVMLQPLSTTSRFMIIGLSSEELSLIEMSVVSRWTILPRLLGVSGVANVAIWGQRDRQLQVHIDPELMQAHGVSQEQIIETTGDALWFSSLGFLNASVPGSGGWIDTPNQRLGIRHDLPISSPDDLAEVSVAGAPLRLGDVAEVVEGHPPLIGDAIVNDEPGLMLVVEKFPGTSTLEVTRGVEAALDELRPGLPGIEIDTTIFRTATFIETAIDNWTVALIIASILVVLVLLAFRFEWRITLISFLAIPMSLIAASLVLYLLGATINLMVLAGLTIALGAVVDDAVISVENIVRRLRQHHSDSSEKSTAAIILEGSLEIRGALAFATLIVVLAVVPVFLLGGRTGAFLEPLVISYALALAASMLVALTVTPALSLILLSKGPLERRDPLIRWLQRSYERAFSAIIHRRPRVALMATGVIVLAGLAVLPSIGRSLFDNRVTVPSFQETDLLIEVEAWPGTSHPEMVRIVTRVGEELQSIPGVDNVAAHLGRAVTGDQVVGTNSSQLWVSVDPNADYGKTVAAIDQTIDGYPGLDGNVEPYLKGRLRDVLTGAGDPIVVRIYGPVLEVLRSQAEKVRENLSEIDGIVDLRVQGQDMEPHVEIEVDLVRARSFGLTAGDVRRSAATTIAGIQVGSLFEEQKVFEVAVWSTPETRQSLTSLRELQIDTPDGGRVRLGDVAAVRVVSIPTVIRHEANQPYVDVLADVRGRDVGSVTAEVEDALGEMEFPLEYNPALLGEFAEFQSDQRRGLGITIAVVIGIFLLLQASFGSWRLASLTFLALPAALVGGVLAAFAGGGLTSLGSMAGLLAVFGIAVRNGVLLINHYLHLEEQEGAIFGPELVLRGTRERLAPILISATTTALAVLPLVVLGDIAGLEIVHPMSVVILGGLFTSTLFALFVIPVLYLQFGRRGGGGIGPMVRRIRDRISASPRLLGGS